MDSQRETEMEIRIKQLEANLEEKNKTCELLYLGYRDTIESYLELAELIGNPKSTNLIQQMRQHLDCVKKEWYRSNTVNSV